jgi:hypothetical protein
MIQSREVRSPTTIHAKALKIRSNAGISVKIGPLALLLQLSAVVFRVLRYRAAKFGRRGGNGTSIRRAGGGAPEAAGYGASAGRRALAVSALAPNRDSCVATARQLVGAAAQRSATCAAAPRSQLSATTGIAAACVCSLCGCRNAGPWPESLAKMVLNTTQSQKTHRIKKNMFVPSADRKSQPIPQR